MPDSTKFPTAFLLKHILADSDTVRCFHDHLIGNGWYRKKEKNLAKDRPPVLITRSTLCLEIRNMKFRRIRHHWRLQIKSKKSKSSSSLTRFFLPGFTESVSTLRFDEFSFFFLKQQIPSLSYYQIIQPLFGYCRWFCWRKWCLFFYKVQILQCQLYTIYYSETYKPPQKFMSNSLQQWRN